MKRTQYIAYFKVPYREKDNNNYLENDNFCCGDKKSSKGDGITDNEDPELNQFYYHSDHLGSSSYITNLSGNIVQHIEYVPFGEVFIEERNNKWNTPYLFNGKELDEETGLYYYGARYYNSRNSLWLSVDPLAEKYPGISPYCYTLNNPVKFIDPDGRDWILATGNKVYWYGGKYGDKSNLRYTFKASSGIKFTSNGRKYDFQKAKYQNIKGRGPTVEGKYRINLKPSPNRIADVDSKGNLLRSNGIVKVGKIHSEDGKIYDYTESWGNYRARLEPVDVKHPIYKSEEYDLSKEGKRDLNSFYLHDSNKGGTSGCHEVETELFDKLIEYRNDNNTQIEVQVKYPNKNHKTYGETDK